MLADLKSTQIKNIRPLIALIFFIPIIFLIFSLYLSLKKTPILSYLDNALFTIGATLFASKSIPFSTLESG